MVNLWGWFFVSDEVSKIRSRVLSKNVFTLTKTVTILFVWTRKFCSRFSRLRRSKRARISSFINKQYSNYYFMEVLKFIHIATVAMFVFHAGWIKTDGHDCPSIYDDARSLTVWGWSILIEIDKWFLSPAMPVQIMQRFCTYIVEYETFKWVENFIKAHFFKLFAKKDISKTLTEKPKSTSL